MGLATRGLSIGRRSTGGLIIDLDLEQRKVSVSVNILDIQNDDLAHGLLLAAADRVVELHVDEPKRREVLAHLRSVIQRQDKPALDPREALRHFGKAGALGPKLTHDYLESQITERLPVIIKSVPDVTLARIRMTLRNRAREKYWWKARLHQNRTVDTASPQPPHECHPWALGHDLHKVRRHRHLATAP